MAISIAFSLLFSMLRTLYLKKSLTQKRSLSQSLFESHLETLNRLHNKPSAITKQTTLKRRKRKTWSSQFSQQTEYVGFGSLVLSSIVFCLRPSSCLLCFRAFCFLTERQLGIFIGWTCGVTPLFSQL